MLKLIVLFSLVLAGSVQAADHFTCKVKESGQTVTVKFAVNNLSKPSKATLVNLSKDDEWAPILVSPQRLKNGYFAEMCTLNDQGGDLRVDSEKLKLFGDGDGYTLVDLVLYKNSGFTRGYVRVYGSVTPWYQKIACTRK
jgi:hypothetical protein